MADLRLRRHAGRQVAADAALRRSDSSGGWRRAGPTTRSRPRMAPPGRATPPIVPRGRRLLQAGSRVPAGPRPGRTIPGRFVVDFC